MQKDRSLTSCDKTANNHPSSLERGEEQFSPPRFNLDLDASSLNGKWIIIGMGNPILGDDGVGWQVALQVEAYLLHKFQGTDTPIPVILNLAVGGLSLMEYLIGYERAILIDAIQTGTAPVGTVTCFPIEELPNRAAGHLCSAHDTTLQNAIQMGRTLGARLPDQITIVAIEAEMVYDFTESMSPEVNAAVPTAFTRVIQILDANF